MVPAHPAGPTTCRAPSFTNFPRQPKPLPQQIWKVVFYPLRPKPAHSTSIQRNHNRRLAEFQLIHCWRHGLTLKPVKGFGTVLSGQARDIVKMKVGPGRSEHGRTIDIDYKLSIGTGVLIQAHVGCRVVE